MTLGEKQYFVTVSDEFVGIRRLVKQITADKFEIGNWQFIKCKYEESLGELREKMGVRL